MYLPTSFGLLVPNHDYMLMQPRALTQSETFLMQGYNPWPRTNHLLDSASVVRSAISGACSSQPRFPSILSTRSVERGKHGPIHVTWLPGWRRNASKCTQFEWSGQNQSVSVHALLQKDCKSIGYTCHCHWILLNTDAAHLISKLACKSFN